MELCILRIDKSMGGTLFTLVNMSERLYAIHIEENEDRQKGVLEMNMKKIVSGAAAVVLALGLAVPAFAATPGEVANDTAWEIIGLTQHWEENPANAAKAEAAMQRMVTNLQDNTATVSTSMTSAGLAYYDALEENDVEFHSASSGSADIQWKVRYTDGTFASVAEAATCTADGNVITFEADAQGNSSSTGYAVTVYLPDNTTATQYSVKMLGDNAQPNDTVVPVKSYVEEDGTTQKYVSFWVPHFTTYQLTAVTLNTPVQQPSNQQPAVDEHPEIADAIANGTWGQSTTTTAGGSAAAAPAAENPIKKTGLAMDFTAFAVVALAAAAVCGLGYAVKKSK